jgi:hypothetical protein
MATSISASLVTPKTSQANAAVMASERILNKDAIVAPRTNLTDNLGRPVSHNSYNTLTAGAHTALAIIGPENERRSQTHVYLDMDGIQGDSDYDTINGRNPGRRNSMALKKPQDKYTSLLSKSSVGHTLDSNAAILRLQQLGNREFDNRSTSSYW